MRDTNPTHTYSKLLQPFDAFARIPRNSLNLLIFKYFKKYVSWDTYTQQLQLSDAWLKGFQKFVEHLLLDLLNNVYDTRENMHTHKLVIFYHYIFQGVRL